MLNMFGGKEQKEQQIDEFVVLGHLIKYNLYLLAKSVVFSAVLKQNGDVQASVNETHQVMQALDLDAKRKSPSE